jgi:tungstate transport system ATP-binding protein
MDPTAGEAKVSVAETIIAAEGLKVELGGVRVLDIPSLHVYEKETLTIVGPNGCGKSTLLQTLACLLNPVAGRISYRGTGLDSREAGFRFRRKISMVFQEPLLFDTTAYRNVAAGLEIRGFSKSDTQDRVMKYLKCFHGEQLVHRSARKLSGGEAQRVSLARAFAVEPEILFLDEPFSALDPPTRHSLIHDLTDMIKETGTTTVMITHVESEALNMSHRIAVMNDGQIVQTGSPSMVMNNPLNEFVAKFVGMETILQGIVLERRDETLIISVSGKEIHAADQASLGEEVVCCIRPENVLIGISDADGLRDNRNNFVGCITQIYSMGPFLKLHLDCGFPLAALATRDRFDALNLVEGMEIRVSFKPASVHLIKKAS